MGVDLIGQPVGFLPVREVVPAGFGGDREAGRHGKPEVGHLGEVGPLAAEEILHVPVAFGEVVDVLRCRHGVLRWRLWERRQYCWSRSQARETGTSGRGASPLAHLAKL
jgi:hypothetical protein